MNRLAIIKIPGSGGGSGPTPANPTALVGLTVVNGSATTYMRSDAAPALDQSIAPIWTGIHTFTTLAGTGVRMVVADTSGVLSTQSIPTTQANDGLTASSNIVKLGQTVGALLDPAQLLENREVPLAGLQFSFKGNNLGGGGNSGSVSFGDGSSFPINTVVNANNNTSYRIQNTSSGNSAICGIQCNNDTNKSALFRISSSAYSAINFVSDAITIDGSATNGIFMNARGGANAGIYFAVNGIGQAFTKMVLNPAGNLILSSGTITPTDDGAKLQVVGPTALVGAHYLKVRNTTANTTLDETDFQLLVDATAGSIVITLPTATSSFKSTDSVGRVYSVIKTDSTVNTVTLQTQGSDKINGVSTQIILTQFNAISFQAVSTSSFLIF